MTTGLKAPSVPHTSPEREVLALPSEGLAIVVPVRDERAALGRVLDGLRAASTSCEVVVVDDGSQDGSADIARERGVSVIRHHEPRGYGAALKAGIAATTTEHIAIIDADGTYDPTDVVRLARAVPRGGMVVGARREPSLTRRLIKDLFRWQVRLATGLSVPDLNSGLRVFDRQLVLRLMAQLPDRFSFTTSLTLGALAIRAPVAWLPIRYLRRRAGRSKFGLRDVVFMARVVFRGCRWVRGGSVDCATEIEPERAGRWSRASV